METINDNSKNSFVSNIVKLLIAASFVIALCVTFGFMNANADTSTYSYDNSYLSKNVQAPSIASFDQSFTFNFEAYEYDQSFDNLDKLPAISSQSIPFKVVDGDIQNIDGYSYAKVGTDPSTAFIGQLQLSKFMPTVDKFPNAGEYGYKVTEQSFDGAIWVDSEAEYILRVYVKNTDGGLEIVGATFEQIKDDSGNEVEVIKKDPQLEPGRSNETTTVRKKGTDVDTQVYNGFTFMNEYNPVSDLTITNKVNGEYADKTYEWPITVTLDNEELANKTIEYVVYKEQGSDPSSCTVTFDENGKATVNEKLLDGGHIDFTEIPVGTKYSVSETGYEDYAVDASSVSKQEGDVRSSDNTTGGKGITVTYGNDYPAAIVGSNLGNQTDLINTKPNIDPTDFIIDNAPYIIMIGLAVVAFGAWIVVSRRKNQD